MIKATGTTPKGTKVLLIGLSHRNLDKLREDGLKGYIKVDGDAIGWPGHQIMITAGETEAVMAEVLGEFIGPETIVNTSDKLKN